MSAFCALEYLCMLSPFAERLDLLWLQCANIKILNKKELTNQLSYVIIITESTDDGCFRTYDYEITAKLVAGRLFLFIYVVDVIQQNEDQTDNSQYITEF